MSPTVSSRTIRLFCCCGVRSTPRTHPLLQVYPTYLWAEEDLTLLEGSPVIAATESMRRKLEAEYATVESDLLEKFPKVWECAQKKTAGGGQSYARNTGPPFCVGRHD